MNAKIKQYLTNYLGDLHYWSGVGLESVNHYTSGTPSMDSHAQLAAYIKPLEDLLKEEDNELKKSQIGSLQHWEKTFLEGGVDDEHSVFIAGVLAAERRNLEHPALLGCVSGAIGISDTYEIEEQDDEV